MSILSKPVDERAERLLIKYPYLRDNDRKLIATFWKFELGPHKYHQIMNTRDFLKLVANELTNPESIRRSRQKLQFIKPELRGERYKERHLKLEPEVREEIKSFNS